MKKLLIIIFIITISTTKCFCQVNVNGYFRYDGTYVVPHVRSSPDGDPFNNYSFPGNINPYTGKVATGNVDTYLRRYYNRLGNSSGRYISAPKNISLGFSHLEKNELNKAKEYFIKGYNNDPYNAYEKQIQLILIAQVSVLNKEFATAERYLNKIKAENYDNQFSEELGFLYYDLFKQNGRTIDLIKTRYFFEKTIEKEFNNCTLAEILLWTYHYFKDEISFKYIATKSKVCRIDLRFHTNQSDEMVKIKEMLDLGIITIEEYNQQIKKFKTNDE